MKLIVDFDMCEANGLCTAAAPEVFELDDEDKLQVRFENVDEARRSKLEHAVRLCPRAALRLSEEP